MVVTLSRRNLLTLLAKLDGHPPHSACTILLPGGEGAQLLVRAEENDEHYEKRSEPPAPAHPDTEAASAAGRQ